MSWEASFDEPIKLPSVKVLLTLRDAGQYIAALPKAVHKEHHLETAINAPLLAAGGGPSMFARISLMRAIYPPADPVYDPKRNHVWRKAARR